MSPGPDGLQESSTKYLKTNWLQNYSFFQKIEKSLYNWLYEISVILVPKVDKKKKKRNISNEAAKLLNNIFANQIWQRKSLTQKFNIWKVK